MKKPLFWNKKKSWQTLILSPLGALYEWTVRCRFMVAKPYQSKIPVVCVGNIVVGGSGKTPVCIALAQWFQKKGKKVVFLNHGYHSRIQNVMVDLKEHTSDCISDEALLLAKYAPTVVDKNRKRGVSLAEKMGADVILMDDGFQNPSVIKKVSFLVFDGAVGIGNGYPLPAGPLRETLSQGLKRADAIVCVGEDSTFLEQQVRILSPSLSFLTGGMEPPDLTAFKGKKAVAFAGIGRPEKFFSMLTENGIVLEQKISFPDHYRYQKADLDKILSYQCVIFTTTKDAIKIPGDLLAQMVVVDAPFVFNCPQKWNCFLEKELL